MGQALFLLSLLRRSTISVRTPYPLRLIRGTFICLSHEASVSVSLMEDSLHRSKAAFFPQEAIVDPLQEHLDC